LTMVLQVKIFRLVEVKEGDSPLHVELVTEWDYSYVLQCMAASGDTLIIGDVVRSVALLDIDWNEGKLERKARDHQDLGPYRLAASGDKGIIGSNVSTLSSSAREEGSHVWGSDIRPNSGTALPHVILLPVQRFDNAGGGRGFRSAPARVKIHPRFPVERGRRRDTVTHPPLLHELGTHRNHIRTRPVGVPRLDAVAK
jgi:hypothetical protein